jgi:hypothetical protein
LVDKWEEKDREDAVGLRRDYVLKVNTFGLDLDSLQVEETGKLGTYLCG